jgi:hypothetical protein
MATEVARGSDKVMAAWHARVLTDESIGEIAKQLEKSPATIESADVVGGQYATGLRVSLRYDGDDGPMCGNDILFWLKWHCSTAVPFIRRRSSSTGSRSRI